MKTTRDIYLHMPDRVKIKAYLLTIKKYIFLLVLFISISVLTGCGKKETYDGIKIGVCVYDQYDTFLTQLLESFDECIEENVSVEYVYASQSQTTQNDQVQSMIAGRELGTTGRKVNNILAGAGYQHKIGDKWEPIGPGESYAVMLDTGKQHSNGTPVRQLKWDSSIVEIVRGLKQEEEQV